MSRSIPVPLLLGVGVLLASAHYSLGDDSSPELTKKYHDLIERLASPNKEPITRNQSRGSVKFPAGYDVEAQTRVNAARKVIHENLQEALPFLVDVLDDERYCMTVSWAEGDAYYNYSVGHICRDVIESQLDVYRSKIDFSGPQHWNWYNYTPVSKEWLRTRRGRSLAELQIEAINWAIERRRAEPEEQIRDGRANEVSELEKLRDTISTSGKSVPPGRMLRMVTADSLRQY